MTLDKKDIQDLIELVDEKIKECKESDSAFMRGALSYWRDLKKKLNDLKKGCNKKRVLVLKEIENKIEKWNKEEIKTLKELEKDKKEEDFFGVGIDGFYLWAIRLIISELYDIKRLIEKG